MSGKRLRVDSVGGRMLKRIPQQWYTWRMKIRQTFPPIFEGGAIRSEFLQPRDRRYPTWRQAFAIIRSAVHVRLHLEMPATASCPLNLNYSVPLVSATIVFSALVIVLLPSPRSDAELEMADVNNRKIY